jgi:hypothetical protein
MNFKSMLLLVAQTSVCVARIEWLGTRRWSSLHECETQTKVCATPMPVRLKLLELSPLPLHLHVAGE